MMRKNMKKFIYLGLIFVFYSSMLAQDYRLIYRKNFIKNTVIGLTKVTAATVDTVIIIDATDGTAKKVLVSDIGVSGGSGDFYAADFGDSLVNYDGFGITITNNDAIDIDSSDVVTKYSYDHVTDFLNFGQDYPKGAEADTSWFWKNKTGATVTIDSIEAISDFNTFRMIWVESDENGGNVSRVDSMACTVAGTNRYYKTEATISAATIESNHWIGLVRSVDEADYFSAAINYHYVRP